MGAFQQETQATQNHTVFNTLLSYKMTQVYTAQRQNQTQCVEFKATNYLENVGNSRVF